MDNLILIEDLGMEYPTSKSKKKKHFGLYKCFCGKEFKTIIHNVKNGITKSCGCFKRYETIKRLTTHGKTKHPIYLAYRRMWKRCYNKNDSEYCNYGGAGITVCDEWLKDFMSFYNWAINNGFSTELSLNRKKILGNYCPENCNWADRPEQSQNTRLLSKRNKWGYRGVSKRGKKWIARIQNYYDKHELGLFDTKEAAAQAYNDFVIENKTYHPLNIIP